jgi:hypothetical protein
MIAPQQAASTPFQSASLYVGDLHNEVTEVNKPFKNFIINIANNNKHNKCFNSLESSL